MANNAHFVTSGAPRAPKVTVRDDRGVPVTEIPLPDNATEPAQADEQLNDAGWFRREDATWTESTDGWVAPVVSA
jgi:hypothetical protein